MTVRLIRRTRVTATHKRRVVMIANKVSSEAKASTGVWARPAKMHTTTSTFAMRRSARATELLIHPLLPDIETYRLDVSVIFGTYNRKALLRRCITSVRAACDGLRYEIVICDGGSTDGTQDWLQEQQDVVLIHGNLNGAVLAFNSCFEQSAGRYVVALNDDVEIERSAIKIALRHFDDPMVGQVAFSYLERGVWTTHDVHGRVYVNYGMIRSYVAKAICKICGGYWATVYYTYGGDTELSCWVYRLGYKIITETNAKVVDREVKDGLRVRNAARDQKRWFFWKRWPTPQNMVFRGPHPLVENGELEVLRRLETGELPEARWSRIASADPAAGELPKRGPTRPERILHLHLETNDDPQASMAAAIASLGSAGYERINWTRLDMRPRIESIRQAHARICPTVVFMQLQTPNALSASFIAELRRGTRDPSVVFCVWSGDVGMTNGPWLGSNDRWAYEISKHVDLMLFTGTGQVRMHRERGMINAAYLQIGYDEARYHPGAEESYGSLHSAVFLGQNYAPHWNAIQQNDAQLRRDLVASFQQLPGFGVYGSGWANGRPAAQASVGGIYRRSSLALSVSLTSALERYSSDRLIRAMACGTPTLVKRFADMAGIGLVDGVNCIGWNHADEALEAARAWLEPARREELRAIGRAGARLMKEHHTWSVRMEELSCLLRVTRGM